MKIFKNKVAVITGAASGIGRGMAEAFIAAGMKVMLSDIDERALAETTAALRRAGAEVHSAVVDVARPEQVDGLAKQTLTRFGAVHVLCNNAGVCRGQASWTNSLADWNWMLGVNVMGVVHGVRSFLPIMIEQNTEAHIVNTASVGGLVAAGSVLYGTGKFAVVGLTENLHAELMRGGFKPKVSVLCPGLVDTNIMVSSLRHRPGQSAGSGRPRGILPERARTRCGAMQVVDALKQGLSPRVVGDQVLAAIRDERFYIVTNPEFDSHIKQRAKNILKRF